MKHTSVSRGWVRLHELGTRVRRTVTSIRVLKAPIITMGLFNSRVLSEGWTKEMVDLISAKWLGS